MEIRSTEVTAALETKVRQAEAAYQRARQEYQRLITLSRMTHDLADPGFMDGQHALAKALKIHRHARENYERALQQFTDYILNGKPPERN